MKIETFIEDVAKLRDALANIGLVQAKLLVEVDMLAFRQLHMEILRDADLYRQIDVGKPSERYGDWFTVLGVTFVGRKYRE